MLALHGLPALRYLETDDPEERLILTALARKAQTVLLQIQHNQAVAISNVIGKAWKFR